MQHVWCELGVGLRGVLGFADLLRRARCAGTERANKRGGGRCGEEELRGTGAQLQEAGPTASRLELLLHTRHCCH